MKRCGRPSHICGPNGNSDWGVAHTNALTITTRSVRTISDHEPLRPADGITNGSTGHPIGPFWHASLEAHTFCGVRSAAIRRLFSGSRCSGSLHLGSPGVAVGLGGGLRIQDCGNSNAAAARMVGLQRRAWAGIDLASPDCVVPTSHGAIAFRCIFRADLGLGTRTAHARNGGTSILWGDPLETGRSDTVAFFH